MQRLITLCWIILAVAMLGCQSSADSKSVNNENQTGQKKKGYVLKVGEGELAGVNGTLIKASPKSGTQGAVLMQDQMPKDFTTGLHYHKTFDEFFYILKGNGKATIDELEYKIEPGDVVFVPVGSDHNLLVTSDTLEVLIFLDKPGLEEEFRESHRKFEENSEPMTLEEINAIANKYGTVYKTLK